MMGLGPKHKAYFLADELWLHFYWNASTVAGRETSFGAKALLLHSLETTCFDVFPYVIDLCANVVRRCFLIR